MAASCPPSYHPSRPPPRFFFAPPLLLLVVMGSVAGRTRPFGLTDCHGECRGPLHWDQKKKRGCSVAYCREVLAVVHLFSRPTPPSALRPGLDRASLPGFGPGSPCNISNPLKLGTPRVILDIYANELTKRGKKGKRGDHETPCSTEWVGMSASPPAPVCESVQVYLGMCVVCVCWCHCWW